MPYADPEAQRAYQREWYSRRRAAWFEGKVCIDCGSTDRLELDHVDPAVKVSHRIWSWSKARREAELAKCVVRCYDHHMMKSITERASGEAHASVTLSTVEITAIRTRWENGERQIDIARSLGVSKQFVYNIVHRRTRIHEGVA